MRPEHHQLTRRQQREVDFHRGFAGLKADEADRDVEMDVVESRSRRPWNAFWSMYDHILASGLAGRHVVVPGCGFGPDLIRIARLGAIVSAFDISPEVAEIARRRVANLGVAGVDIRVTTAEAMSYPDNSFDAMVLVDILHHVDIPAAMREARRVLRPGGLIIGDELYTHSLMQRIRESRLVVGTLYPLMRKWIYGDAIPYITPDEHKIDEHEFAIVRGGLDDCRVAYFGFLEGRLFPNHIVWASRIDHMLMRIAGPFAALLGGRVVFAGRIREDGG